MLYCWPEMISWTGWTELQRSGGRKWDVTDNIASKTCYSNVQGLYNYKLCRGTHDTAGITLYRDYLYINLYVMSIL